MQYRFLIPIIALGLGAPLMAANTPKQPDTPTTPMPNAVEKLAPVATPVTPDYAAAEWVPASPDNWTEANRPAVNEINMILIHDIEGSAAACLSWFQNPQAQATSHYVVDSSTGQVYQMVREHDIAWHAGNWDVNKHSIGIENSGYAYRPGFYTPVGYEALAKLVRDISIRYTIPRDRQHIIGHSEVPDPDRPGQFGGSGGHTDPGPYWDWDSFMTVVKEDAKLVSSDFPKVIHPGELIPVTVKYTNGGDDPWTTGSRQKVDPTAGAVNGVFLGTWAPFRHPSPFFSFRNCVSPVMLAEVPSGETAPGAEAAFSFSILGPRTLGTVREDYRVTSYPPAPKTPTAFGDALSISVEVKPWSLEFAAADAGFTGAGWTADGNTLWRASGPGEPFAWNPAIPISGNWDVFARWPDGRTKTRKATFTIAGAKEPVTVTVDQRKGKGKWIKLGRYAFDNPKAVSVTLTAEGNGRVVADSLKFEGPF
jgi:hypothetical protein